MRGFGAFLGKELREILRTWRIWVLPGIVLFFAITGPPLAKVTPQILESFAGSQPGVIMQLPTPTYVDAYASWIKNLSQMMVFAVIIIFGGLVTSETKSGTAVLVLTKPLSRPAFVLAKFVSALTLLTGSIALGAVVTWGITRAVFGEAPVGLLAETTGAWLAFGVVLLGVMTLLSASVSSQAGAAGAGFGVFVVMSLLTLWEPMVRYTPAGLVGAASAVLADKHPDLLWPLVTGALMVGLCVAAAVGVFARREL
jgi:ABC-2 type transport system permease protein